MADIVLNPGGNSTSNSNEDLEKAKEERNICRIFVDESIEKQIILDELSADVTEIPSNDGDVSISNKNIAGREYPVIKIGDFIPTVAQISKLRISNSGRLPTISLSLTTTTTAFQSKSMPKDGDIISVFIAPKSDTLASIRCDFVINSVNPKRTAKGIDVSFTGVLFVPGFSADTMFGTVGTSKEAFIESAKKFGLGFATNDSDDTDDKQMWLCYNISCENYLNKVIKHAWKDEMSFYDWWIDEHYNINFINVNKMLLENKKDFDITANTMNAGGDYDSPMDYSQKETKATNKVFTNVPEYSMGAFYVKNWRVRNNSSSISMEEGVEIKSNEFRHNEAIYMNAENPVLTLSNVPAYDPDKVDNHILLRGRPSYNKDTNPEGEQARANYNFKDIYIQTPWAGIDYVMSDGDADEDDTTKWSGNVSKNYTRAEYHNSINLSELEKMYIEIETDGLCLQVMRGEVVPVGLKIDDSVAATVGHSEQVGRAERFYNGFYYVQAIEYDYVAGNPSHYKTKLKLTKREWPIPVDYMEPSEK